MRNLRSLPFLLKSTSGLTGIGWTIRRRLYRRLTVMPLPSFTSSASTSRVTFLCSPLAKPRSQSLAHPTRNARFPKCGATNQ